MAGIAGASEYQNVEVDCAGLRSLGIVSEDPRTTGGGSFTLSPRTVSVYPNPPKSGNETMGTDSVSVRLRERKTEMLLRRP